MRLALCNEVLAPMVFAQQCEMAAALGYQGLEIAPFTLADDPASITAAQRAEVRRASQDAGIQVSSLHWLLRTPDGLSITTADAAVRNRTLDVMHRQIDLCADLGGSVLVHGSPGQRRLPDHDADTARQRGIDAFAAVAQHAADAGVLYCIEPLAPPQNNFIQTMAQAVDIIHTIGHPALRTMLDCYGASHAESEPIAQLIDRWLPTGMLAHVQVNDTNLQGPGQGTLRFADILRALLRHGYDGWIAVEPFEYMPDGPGCAARAIGYLRGVLDTLQTPPDATAAC